MLKKVYYTLLANGWTKQSASGVIGNLLWETGGANSKNPTNISGDINPADKSATRHAGKVCVWNSPVGRRGITRQNIKDVPVLCLKRKGLDRPGIIGQLYAQRDGNLQQR